MAQWLSTLAVRRSVPQSDSYTAWAPDMSVPWVLAGFAVAAAAGVARLDLQKESGISTRYSQLLPISHTLRFGTASSTWKNSLKQAQASSSVSLFFFLGTARRQSCAVPVSFALSLSLSLSRSLSCFYAAKSRQVPRTNALSLSLCPLSSSPGLSRLSLALPSGQGRQPTCRLCGAG